MFCASPRASSRSAASSAAMASLRSISWTTSASVIQIGSLMSHLERGQHLLRKQLFEREPPVADALLEGEIDKGLERLAVRLQSVRPEILAEEGLHARS